MELTFVNADYHLTTSTPIAGVITTLDRRFIISLGPWLYGIRARQKMSWPLGLILENPRQICTVDIRIDSSNFAHLLLEELGTVISLNLP